MALPNLPTLLDLWRSDAKEILKRITDGSQITNRFQDVEKEAMRDVLERVDEVVAHLDKLPKPCNCGGDESCPGWQIGYGIGLTEAS